MLTALKTIGKKLMPHVHIITPVTQKTDALKGLEYLEKDGLVLTNSNLANGPASIECEYDELLAGPETILRALKAEREGADAIVINCMGDPALDAVREVVSVPVIGCGQTAMHYAAMLGHKFSVLPTLERRKFAYPAYANKYGLLSKLASVRPTGIPVREIDTDPKCFESILACALAAIEEDGADAIVFGCTHFRLDKELTQALSEKGLDVPVINPLPLAILAAANIATLNLCHSKMSYPVPPQKQRPGYEHFEL